MRNDLVDKMSTYQLSRWLALFEAIDLVAEQAQKDGNTFNNISLKPIAIEKYVDSCSDIIYRSLNER